MLAGRAVTLRSERLPQRMAAGAVVLVQALLLQVSVDAVVASGQKVHRPVLRERTVAAAEDQAGPPQAYTL